MNENQRQKAIDWLNSTGRSFARGVEILETAGFKPGVVRRLKTLGESDTAMMHLVENVRQYLRFIGIDVEDTDAELGVIDGAQPEELLQEEDKGLSIDELAVKVETGERALPETAGKAVVQYARWYREREKAHRKMAEIAETNEPEHVEKRKQLSDSIDELTSKMERVYPLIREYLEHGVVPAEEDLQQEDGDRADTATDAQQEDAEKDEDLDAFPKDVLQKRLKSAKTKILRKSNLLEYQQETKAEVPNPLPDCPKRVKYEKEIAKLQKEVEALQWAIARKG